MSFSKTRQSNRFVFWLYELDRILRGEATRLADIRKAEIQFPVLGVVAVICVLAVTYGFCMGVFAMVRGFEQGEYQQSLYQTMASMCKVPMLYLLTLIVTFPSLYVFNALVGSQLKMLPVLKLLIASLAVNLAVLASMGPILAFFSVSTPNYGFIVLLNVVVFGVAGGLGLVFLIQTLNRITLVHQDFKRDETPNHSNSVASEEKGEEDVVIQAEQVRGPLEKLEGVVLSRHVKKVFFCWLMLFGLVGAQMGWVLRPFIGSPNKPFQWLRPRESNFFESVWQTFWQTFIG